MVASPVVEGSVLRLSPAGWLSGLVSISVVACVEYEPVGNLDYGDPTVSSPSDGPPKEVPEGSALDAWDLPEAETIDVIVFADNSSSMEEELRTLGQSVTPFVERLATQVADWQLAAITGNTGCAGSGVLDALSTDYAAKFAVAVTTPTGAESEDEMAFQNVAKVVENSGPGACNDGLVRGGLLHLVFVSDENDESPGFDTNPDYWRTYLDRIVAVHGDPESIVISAVAGPTPDGCEREAEQAEAAPGDGYDVAVAGTGGEFLSICDDWAAQIDVLADAGTVRSEFPLSERPVDGTIEVWVDQIERPTTDWRYDTANNEVVFVHDPPRPGDRVDVLYVVDES